MQRLRESGGDMSRWSPNGREILFQRGRFYCGDVACAVGIYVMHADGTGAHLLARRADGDAAWSPDGRRIAFSESKAEFDNDIYVMNADGSNKRGLTQGAVDSSDFSPAWSPDGTRIAFSRYLVSEDTSEIYAMKPDGSHLRRLTQHQSQFPPYDDDPVWSPNGSRIAFDRLTHSGHSCQVFVMNADGRGARNVSPGIAWDERPLWEPRR